LRKPIPQFALVPEPPSATLPPLHWPYSQNHPNGLVYAEDASDAGDDDEPSYILSRFRIALGRPTLLTGKGGVGKTILLRDLGLAVASEDPKQKTAWGGLRVEGAGRVLHLNYEEPEGLHRHYWKRMARGRGFELASLGNRVAWWTFPHLRLSNDDFGEFLMKLTEGVTLCTIDSLATACLGSDHSENAKEYAEPLSWLARISHVNGVCFLVNQHEGHAGAKRGAASRSRGTTAIVDNAQCTIAVSSKDGQVRKLEHGKNNLGPNEKAHTIRFVDDGDVDPKWRVSERLRVEACTPEREEKDNVLSVMNATAEQNRKSAQVQNQIVDVLRKAGKPLSGNEVCDRITGRKATTKAELAELVDAGKVLEQDGPRGPVHTLAPANDDDEDRPF
jgi:AAA domain-containing protein